MKLANLLKHKTMSFCSSPFGIAPHSAKWSRVLISGRRFFIMRLIGAVIGGVSLSRHCFAAFAFSSQYWATLFRASVRTIWKAASWRSNCRYACLQSIIALSGSSELASKRLPCWQISSQKWFKRCITRKLKSDSSTGCCAMSDSICILFSSTQWRVASAERLIQAG